jgi:hypothetical protein
LINLRVSILDYAYNSTHNLAAGWRFEVPSSALLLVFALSTKTDEKPYFIVAYKSSGEGDPLRLTLITSAARLAASVLSGGCSPLSLE